MSYKTPSYTLRNLFMAGVVSTLLLPGVTLAQQIDNPENPYDEVGRWHNQALDQAVVHVHELGYNPVSFILAAGESIQDFTEQTVGAEGVGHAHKDTIARLHHDRDTVLEELRGQLSEEQGIFFDALKTAVESMSDAYGTGLESSQSAEALDGVRAVESQMLAQLSDDDARLLLIAASVARHSFAYWSEQRELRGDSPWNPPGAGLKFPPSPQDADAWGAVIGGLGGLAGGPLGVLGGALEGGGISSGVAWIAHWLGF